MADPILYRNQFVFYGDGTMVQFIRMKQVISPKGVKILSFLLKPGTEAIWRYHLKENIDLDENGLIVRSYPAHLVLPLDNDPNHARFFIKTDLNNRPTNATREIEAMHYHIENLEELNSTLKAWIARLQEEAKLLAGNVEESLRMSVGRVKIAREGAAQIRRESEGGDLYGDFESEGEMEGGMS